MWQSKLLCVPPSHCRILLLAEFDQDVRLLLAPYVFSESISPLLNQLLSLETCLGAFTLLMCFKARHTLLKKQDWLRNHNPALPAKTWKPSAASASITSNTPKNQTCRCQSTPCYSVRFSESIFLLLDQTLNIQACLGSVYSADMFQSSLHSFK